jgi:hypothetical protein
VEISLLLVLVVLVVAVREARRVLNKMVLTALQIPAVGAAAVPAAQEYR